MKRYKLKSVEALGVSDLKQYPVWEFVSNDAIGELAVRPIKKLPVKTLNGRLVGTKMRLSNGEEIWGLLGNASVHSAKLNEHFITLSVERNGQWFTLARYHDIDYAERGPSALAAFLELSVVEVFPISYEIGKSCLGEPSALSGVITEKPREKLTRAQIIALAVP